MAKMPQASNKLIIIVAVIGIICLVLGNLIAPDDEDFTKDLMPQKGDKAALFKTDTEAESSSEVDATEAAAQEDLQDFDLDSAVRERILGNESAPIKMVEHSSFSCGHCGHFHRDIFGTFKEKYIDTGKVYLVFSDFPLNAPAMHASMVARCAPEDRYFDFVEKLFADQDKWAYEKNYTILLKNMASEFGVDAALFESCVNNDELQEALVNKIRAVQELYQVNATPSFVINNQKVITGATNFEAFDKTFRQAVKDLGALELLGEEIGDVEGDVEEINSFKDIIDETIVEPNKVVLPQTTPQEGQ